MTGELSCDRCPWHTCVVSPDQRYVWLWVVSAFVNSACFVWGVFGIGQLSLVTEWVTCGLDKEIRNGKKNKGCTIYH